MTTMTEGKIATIEYVRRYEAQGYCWDEALALAGIREVGETWEEWQQRTSASITKHALHGLGEALANGSAS